MTNDNEDLGDLFAYPARPGHRGVETSIDAAVMMETKAGRLQRLALEAIRDAGENGLTTHELAALLLVPRDSIQPRTSELRARRLIGDSGMRRKNESGVRAIVWIAACHLAQAEALAA